ncbi:hypothetical protein EJ04DRAFT_510800 [Polyplosphaeria fusca]|uniref:Uncharacterized protein n=1 Tax=Polyplosphaeria fusca TaxID=682080 RepID=A0A9P4R0B5_9PLEO|nr:hypothetical protein EJ04DRAFT_510800 [Polyplosphaeria fusca]
MARKLVLVHIQRVMVACSSSSSLSFSRMRVCVRLGSISGFVIPSYPLRPTTSAIAAYGRAQVPHPRSRRAWGSEHHVDTVGASASMAKLKIGLRLHAPKLVTFVRQ